MTHDGAVISECGRYRYRLWRRIGPVVNRRCLFVMLNPSTADATQDDPTIRRCIGFARREVCGWLDVVNLYGWRATLPGELRYVEDPIGPGNDAAIERALLEADVVVVGWGATVGPIASRPAAVLDMIHRIRTPFALGFTANGNPRHPLFVRKDAPLVLVSRG